jgi:hypothetical protein
MESFNTICDKIFGGVHTSTMTLGAAIRLLEDGVKTGWPVMESDQKRQLMSLFGWNVIIQHIVRDASFDSFIRDLAATDRFSGEVFAKPMYDPPTSLCGMDLDTCIIHNMRIHEDEDCPNNWCPDMGNCECFGLTEDTILYDCRGDDLFSYETDESSSDD